MMQKMVFNETVILIVNCDFKLLLDQFNIFTRVKKEKTIEKLCKLK